MLDVFKFMGNMGSRFETEASKRSGRRYMMSLCLNILLFSNISSVRLIERALRWSLVLPEK
jgi:hypothetical protein